MFLMIWDNSDCNLADGVVSVPTQWALDLGLTTSLANPDQPDQSVYQVDMYHSLHCLVCTFSLMRLLLLHISML